MDIIIKSLDSILYKVHKIPASNNIIQNKNQLRGDDEKDQKKKNRENGGQFPLRIYLNKLIKSQIN